MGGPVGLAGAKGRPLAPPRTRGPPQFGEGLASYSAEALSASAISMGNR